MWKSHQCVHKYLYIYVYIFYNYIYISVCVFFLGGGVDSTCSVYVNVNLAWVRVSMLVFKRVRDD